MKFVDEKTVKFVIVGILNTIVGYAINFAALNIFKLNFYIAGLLNYIPTSVMSFFLNKYFTFKSKGDLKKEALRFVLNIGVCWILAYGLAKPAVEYLMSRAGVEVFDFVEKITFGILAGKASITDNIATIVGMGLFVVFNYTGQRFFAFKHEE